jgi:hypothetical protein
MRPFREYFIPKTSKIQMSLKGGTRIVNHTLTKSLFLSMGLWALLPGCATGPNIIQGEYEVTGSSGVNSASITYLQPSGVTSFAVSVALPWTYSFNANETEGNYQGSSVYLSAQNDTGSGSVTVVILESGTVYEHSWALWPQAAITIQGNF